MSLSATVAQRILMEGPQPVVAAAAAEGVHISAKGGIRWCLAGVNGVRLESIRIGGRRMTSRAAFRRFVEGQQRNATPLAQALDLEAADAVLAAHGIARGGDQ